MCGRYASSRRPEDLIEEFEVVDSRVPEALNPDYNVAPTKEVYAVVERPPSKEEGEKGAPAERQLRTLTWGLIPSWAKDPKIGSRMINARMETVAEKPSFRRAFSSRRCLLPADGYYEWYATSELGKSGKPLKQPFFIRPKDHGVLAMAGLYEIWRDPDKAEDDPDRFRWTCTVITTDAEDDVGPHPRPDAADGREGPLVGAGWTRPRRTRTTCWRCWCRPRPVRSRPIPSPRPSATSATTAPS